MTDAIHVLVVDDDDDVREVLAMVLEAEGFRVSCAANGLKALEAWDDLGRPGLVLLDLRMPVMSGWDVIERLRQQGRLPGRPIVICTSSPQDAPAGFPVVSKPVELDAVVAAIRENAA